MTKDAIGRNSFDQKTFDAFDDMTQLRNRIHDLEDAVNAIGLNINRKERNPEKTQEVNWPAMHRALCVDTLDPWKENRVRFYHPIFHAPNSSLLSLPFAWPVSAQGGFDDCGCNWVPPAGSTLVLFFENGNRATPYYVGTVWQRDRGAGGNFGFPVPEYTNVSSGHRKGYLVGPNDESQVFPQWNTESYNNFDTDSIDDFVHDTNAQQRMTYPNIYGWKTPEKHSIKLVDGNAKCDRRWKRIEIQSGCGNWMIFKDDHLHYGGQWAHPSCPPDPGGDDESLCSSGSGNIFTDPQGMPIENGSPCSGQTSSGNIIGGHPSTPANPPYSLDTSPPTAYVDSQTGSNPYFKHQNECRPISGPQTPQNNKIDLPQSGIQFLSISGHSFVMDDSVEEPSGKPTWERSLQPFDFGCSNKFLGVIYLKSATGHCITMSDVEEETGLRGVENYVELRSACGNRIQLNDHTVGGSGTTTPSSPTTPGDTTPVSTTPVSTTPTSPGDSTPGPTSPGDTTTPSTNAISANSTSSSSTGSSSDCQTCPPNYAGEERGIHLISTSNHQINMCDNMNGQCSPCRAEGGDPTAEATKAFIQIRSGYGLEMRFNDDHSQQQTDSQWIQIENPQCAGPADTKCNTTCGSHFLRFQARPEGQKGIIFLRAGGYSIRQTYDMDIVLVGDKDKNPADKFTYVSQDCIHATQHDNFRYAGNLHIFFAEEQILLMAGRDCSPKPGKKCNGPCLYPVIVGRCPVQCRLTGIIHWTEKAMSERVFASAKNIDCLTGAVIPPTGQPAPCTEDETTQTVNTGAGDITITKPDSGGGTMLPPAIPSGGSPTQGPFLG